MVDFLFWFQCAPTLHLLLNMGCIKGSEMYHIIHTFHGDVETNLDLTKKNCRECRHLDLDVNERAGLELGTSPFCEYV